MPTSRPGAISWRRREGRQERLKPLRRDLGGRHVPAVRNRAAITHIRERCGPAERHTLRARPRARNDGASNGIRVGMERNSWARYGTWFAAPTRAGSVIAAHRAAPSPKRSVMTQTVGAASDTPPPSPRPARLSRHHKRSNPACPWCRCLPISLPAQDPRTAQTPLPARSLPLVCRWSSSC